MPNMDELPLYHAMDPHDFRVGRRYTEATPDREHDYTLDRIEIRGDRIWTHTFGGLFRSYPIDADAYLSCDEPGT